MKEQRYDVYWLRVVATLAIFFFHCSRFFDTEGWNLKNEKQSLIVDVLRGGFIWSWIMELFFLLSGVGSWYALKSRTGPFRSRASFGPVSTRVDTTRNPALKKRSCRSKTQLPTLARVLTE